MLIFSERKTRDTSRSYRSAVSILSVPKSQCRLAGSHALQTKEQLSRARYISLNRSQTTGIHAMISSVSSVGNVGMSYRLTIHVSSGVTLG